MHRKLLAIVYLALLLAPLGAQQSSSKAEVRLEVEDGKTQFKLGDLIRLSLVFQDAAFPDVRAEAASGQVSVNATDYSDLADIVTITPNTGWFQWRGRSGHDYMVALPLNATGITVSLVLNQGYVFREPGHYEITVTTNRMGREPKTTNAVGIDLAARSAGEEAALVRLLNITIKTAEGKQRHEAAEQLASLTGDDAARAKVQWLMDSDQDVACEMSNGLAATRDQELQLQLLKEAWSDPTHAPDGLLQTALRRAEAFARGQSEPGWTMVDVRKDNPLTDARTAEFRADLDRVIATLPQRTGNVRRDTAYYLIEDNELSADQLARVRPVVLEEFSGMEPIAKSMLIETRWTAIKDPSLAPELKAMIASKAANDIDAGTAIERLVEIDEREARPYVVAMVCRAERGLLLDKLTGVKEDRLPEVDACLTSILSKGERSEHDFDWEQAAQRAARFATPAILPAVKQTWTNTSQDSSMLALLARDAPQEAVQLLDRKPDIDWYATDAVFEALGGKLPPEVLAWLRRPQAPRSASYRLASFGDPQDRWLLEKQLDELRELWHGRNAELAEAKPNTPAALARTKEEELVGALLGAKAWSLTNEQKQRITDGCMTEACKRYAPDRSTTR